MGQQLVRIGVKLGSFLGEKVIDKMRAANGLAKEAGSMNEFGRRGMGRGSGK